MINGDVTAAKSMPGPGKVKAPDPVTLSVPQFSVPPLFTVTVPVVAKEFVSRVPVGLFVLLMVRLKIETAVLILKVEFNGVEAFPI